MNKPTRADLDQLRFDLDDWQKGGPEPSEVVPRVQRILDAVRGQGDYLELEGFVSDPDSVEIIDVLRDLGDAKPLLAE
jgi:hypothetical protein